MKQIKGGGLKILKAAHLAFACMWVGGALGLMALLLAASPQESHEMYMRSRAVEILDDWIVIPGAMGCLLTGLIYGVWTSWGFFRHRWVAVKWMLTVTMILVGTFLMGPWVDGNVYPVADIAKYAPDNKAFFDNVSNTLLFGYGQVFCLMAVVVVSVFRPWRTGGSPVRASQAPERQTTTAPGR